jgi:hypothetical protein
MEVKSMDFKQYEAVLVSDKQQQELEVILLCCEYVT